MSKTLQTAEYRKAMAVSRSIKNRKNKRAGVVFLCKCLKEMLR